MQRLRPIHAAFLVLSAAILLFVVNFALQGGFTRSDYQRVGPDEQGKVVLDVGDLGENQVRFFKFLNAGNQEVDFFVGRDLEGTLQVAFDANELCYKLKRGYRHQAGEDWVTCNKCDKAFRLSEVNEGGGGCKPVPLAHHLEGDRLVLHENDILTGWRYFR